MMGITNMTNGKGFSTFKFQYSKHNPVYMEPEFVPKDKKKNEFIIAMYYSQFRMMHLGKTIESVALTNDDSEKKPDVTIIENGKLRTMQLTRLSFTNYDMRKSIAKQKSISIARKINEGVKPDFKLNVNIFPKEQKDKIPLKKIKHKKDQIEKKLIFFIIESIKLHIDNLKKETDPVWITIEDPILALHFTFLVLNPIPKDAFSRFYGYNNIFVNYDINDVVFDLTDVDRVIDDLYRKKNGGKAEILLIWANVFEFATYTKGIVDSIRKKFEETTFKEVFLMTFEDNVKLFQDSLQLWPIKVIDWEDGRMRI